MDNEPPYHTAERMSVQDLRNPGRSVHGAASSPAKRRAPAPRNARPGAGGRRINTDLVLQ